MSIPTRPADLFPAPEEAATVRMFAAKGMVHVKVTTLKRLPRMKAPPTPDRCLFASDPVSHEGRLISYRPKREKANQKKRRPTAMLTHGLAAKILGPSAPRRLAKRNPVPVKTMMMPRAYAVDIATDFARDSPPCLMK